MIEKLKMESPDLFQEHIKEIQKLFPDVVTEEQVDGNTKLGIDFEKLKQELSSSLIDDGKERYQMTWPGKMEAIRLSNTPTTATLRPLPEKSVDFDKTQNVYIEGDNLEVLKVIRETYLNKIKMIYIDPPYNTGNDFVYNDKFKQSQEEYQQSTDEYDELGNRMVKNPESNGRYHTDWLNMMYPRLKVARDLLTEDGVLLVSIDDNEQSNLKKIIDEIFGEKNFIAQFIWRGGRRNASKFVSTSHEYMLCYAKDLNYCSDIGVSWHERKKGLKEIYEEVKYLQNKYGNDFQGASKELKEWYKSLPDDSPAKDNEHYNWIDQKGVYFASDISRGGGGGPKWDIVNPTTKNIVQTPARGWSYSSKEDLLTDIKNGLIHFNGDGVPCKKRYLKENESQLVETVFYKDRRGSSKRLRNLMGGDYFPFPKDDEIISKFISVFTSSDSIVLDFFSGSATTGQSVFESNSIDQGHRKFILVQIPELVNLNNDNHEFKTICDIGEERLKRVGIQKEKLGISKNTDFGFRVFKLDSSNMQNDFYSSKEMTKSLIETTIDNVKPDRTDMDLLIQVMLNLGLLLSSKIEKKMIGNKTVFLVNENDLVACFDAGLTNDEIKQIAQLQPVYAAFRDSCFSSDSVDINNEQIFKTISPSTEVKVI